MVDYSKWDNLVRSDDDSDSDLNPAGMMPSLEVCSMKEDSNEMEIHRDRQRTKSCQSDSNNQGISILDPAMMFAEVYEKTQDSQQVSYTFHIHCLVFSPS